MGLFDLLFICAFLATITMLVTAAVFSRSRMRILRWLAGGLAVYFAVVIGSSLVLPQTVLAPGNDRCFDDWCIATERVQSMPSGNAVVYDVRLRLSSRAKRVTQREKDLRVYVTGAGGERIEARADTAAVPFDVALEPGETVLTNRTFDVPATVRDPALVITHGGFPIGWLIIGYDSWFRKPAAMPLMPGRS